MIKCKSRRFQAVRGILESTGEENKRRIRTGF